MNDELRGLVDGLREAIKDWGDNLPNVAMVDLLGHADRITEALSVAQGQGWRPIESAPENVDVLVYCRDQEPAIFSARLVDRDPSVGGMYWHPSEELVADAMADEFNPSHWQPLPAAPAQPDGVGK